MSQPQEKTSRVSQFLLNPYSTVKVVVPSAAIALVLHQTSIKETSLRGLTLGLTLLHTFWFTTTLNMSYIETPLLANVPTLDEWKKLDVGRHRFSWISKIEAVASLFSASLYFNWHHRIINNHGYIDRMLHAAVLAPIAISVIQSCYFIPLFLKEATHVDKGKTDMKEFWSPNRNFHRHRYYIALDTIKITSLGLTAWKFGKMLEN